ncbi:LPS assembly lipoprotein LptE [Limoniibacter endophyticus]|uniref:LPS-assembly lipoprotein n=1 Tax=Limoniibacter endophyticus TaxID=1565040 RepID=A0A8J3GHC3_9HYPH|nr:LPS assembly lipoprotein LptE [Limoniibacter endophyticus]GHC73845.1 hypothetical protein GCM10010136_22320 [Limoniibacter endophyticus]
MSSSEFLSRRSFLGLMAGSGAALAAGCTVRPLYQANSMAPTAASTLEGAVSIDEVRTRYGQEVRNHLIFSFNRGQGQPASARYKLVLGVSSSTASSATIQTTRRDSEPTSSMQTLTGTYVLTEIATGQIVARGRRSVTASFDVSRQEYSAGRARLNAEDRAARELAELIRLAITQQVEQK